MGENEDRENISAAIPRARLPLYGVMLDTQIVSYAFKDRWPANVTPRCITGSHISSVTAHELLGLRARSPQRARYYLFPATRAERYGARAGKTEHLNQPTRLANHRRRASRIVLDFSGEFPTVIEYGHDTTSWLLHRGRTDVFAARIAGLERGERRRLVRIFEYLVSNHIQCIPLDEVKARLAMELLSRYAAVPGNHLKNDFRNSLNDMLILATAIESGRLLLTEDRPLWRFAKATFGLGMANSAGAQSDDQLITLSATPQTVGTDVARKTRSYVNRAWQVRSAH